MQSRGNVREEHEHGSGPRIKGWRHVGRWDPAQLPVTWQISINDKRMVE